MFQLDESLTVYLHHPAIDGAILRRIAPNNAVPGATVLKAVPNLRTLS